uniref:Uncharacterized protein n=1 Tax=Cannabis sativa TaxID=3483 RepID=A0A803QKL7_CANSA
MSNPSGSPLPQSLSGDEFHSNVGDRSPPSPATFSRYYRPSGEAIVGRMMRAYRARVPAEFHALRLHAERRRDYRRMQARNRQAWDTNLERERLANERWVEECLREGAPFYPWFPYRLPSVLEESGLGTHASSRVEAAPPLAMCPFAIFPPILAPVEAVKEKPEVSEGSSTQTTTAYYPEFEATAQSENFEEVPIFADASSSVFSISASSFPQELPRVVSQNICPPSSSNRRGWLAMRRTFQQRESFSV